MFEITDENGNTQRFSEMNQVYKYVYTEGIIANAYALNYDKIEESVIRKGYKVKVLPPKNR